jgi:hypothetical protein
MKYKFTTNPYEQKGVNDFFGVEILDKSIEVLREIAWEGWTSQEVQMIIDNSKALQGDEKFEYQVVGSDLIIVVYPDYVYFFDYHTEQEEEDFKWSFTEFIDFMEKFKKFIEENS